MQKSKHSSLLTCLAAIGTLITIGLAVKAGMETKEKEEEITENLTDREIEERTTVEQIQDHWKLYIPTIVAGASTICCIIAANKVKHQQQIALASAYNLLKTSYSEYKKKTKELGGKALHDKIINSIITEKPDPVEIYSSDVASIDSLDISSTENPEIIRTFYDQYSKRMFESTMSQVLQAEYHLNRNYALSGALYLNDFYEFLGLYGTDGGDQIGWTQESGIYWIDFNHILTHDKNGKEIITIEMPYEPDALEE